MQDIDAAIDNLFNHQNVGPFIAKRLIQQLVKSNPSPAYISRVSGAFNNTKGVRGDMKAVIKAILLDDEARSCSWIENPTSGKLIAPMIRYFNVTRQLDLDNESGVLSTWESDMKEEERALDFEALRYYAKDSEVLINELDKLFTHGQLSEETKQLMIKAIDPITKGWSDDLRWDIPRCSLL